MIKLYYLVLINPEKYIPLASSRSPFILFITALVMSYIQILIVSFIPLNLSTAGTQGVTSILSNEMLLILIPLYEELIFRRPLKISGLHIQASVSLVVSSLLLVLINATGIRMIPFSSYHAYALILTIPIFLILKRFEWSELERQLQKNYNAFFYSSIGLFAAIHFNYQPISVQAVAIYLIYGYSLSFIRVSTNFFNAVALHFLFLLPFYFLNHFSGQ
jgi:hypothetical protein